MIQSKRAELKHLKISDIKIPERFRKDLGDMTELIESVKVKGIIQPISVELNTLNLIAGERRLRAATDAGLTHIPAIIRDTGGSELDRREVELIENINRKDFSWQEKVRLQAEIDRLYKEMNPVGARHGEAGWSSKQTADLLGISKSQISNSLQLADMLDKVPELAECKTEDEARKLINRMVEHAITTELRERQKTVLEKGHLHTVKVADSNYQIGDTFQGLEELRDDGLIHLIECDPPYAIDLDILKDTQDSREYEEIPRELFPEFLNRLCKLLYRKAGKHCWMIFWFGPTHFTLVNESLRRAGWNVRDIPGIWVKPSGQTRAPEHNLANCYEPFFICSKGLPALVKRGRSNVFNFTPVPPSSKYHPTQRPIDLIEELLSTFVSPSCIVLIPFLGSGATLRACYMTGMLGFGWDKNPKYKDKFMLAVEQDEKLLNKEDDDAT